jgi:hypothetical protein
MVELDELTRPYRLPLAGVHGLNAVISMVKRILSLYRILSRRRSLRN